MSPDMEKYTKHVEHFDIPADQKTQLIHLVWKIMENAVDRAFEEDSVQLALTDKHSKSASPAPGVIELSADEYRVCDLTKTFQSQKGGNRK